MCCIKCNSDRVFTLTIALVLSCVFAIGLLRLNNRATRAEDANDELTQRVHDLEYQFQVLLNATDDETTSFTTTEYNRGRKLLALSTSPYVDRTNTGCIQNVQCIMPFQRGFDGKNGSTGPQGEQGLKGDQGIQGVKGFNAYTTFSGGAVVSAASGYASLSLGGTGLAATSTDPTTTNTRIALTGTYTFSSLTFGSPSGTPTLKVCIKRGAAAFACGATNMVEGSTFDALADDRVALLLTRGCTNNCMELPTWQIMIMEQVASTGPEGGVLRIFDGVASYRTPIDQTREQFYQDDFITKPYPNGVQLTGILGLWVFLASATAGYTTTLLPASTEPATGASLQLGSVYQAGRGFVQLNTGTQSGTNTAGVQMCLGTRFIRYMDTKWTFQFRMRMSGDGVFPSLDGNYEARFVAATGGAATNYKFSSQFTNPTAMAPVLGIGFAVVVTRTSASTSNSFQIRLISGAYSSTSQSNPTISLLPATFTTNDWLTYTIVADMNQVTLTVRNSFPGGAVYTTSITATVPAKNTYGDMGNACFVITKGGGGALANANYGVEIDNYSHQGVFTSPI